MAAYRPRRASRRWTEAAPEYVLACYDNRGKTCDRYTVYFGGSHWEPSMGPIVLYLGMSDDPTSPQGFSQWGEVPAMCRPPSRDKVRWLDLPDYIRAHVAARVTESDPYV